jgi:ABC-2 type transport system permease protein
MAIARKDMMDVLRNRSTLMALMTPIFMAALYWVFTVVMTDQVTTLAVYNPGNSALVSTDNLPDGKWNIITAASGEEVRRMVDTNAQNTAVGLVVPADADATMRGGGHPAIEIYFHAAKYGDFSQQVFVATLLAASQRIAGQQPPITITQTQLQLPPDQQGQTKVDMGKRLASIFGMVALLVGLISTGLMLLPTLLVEEKEKKTLRMILASPASYGDVIAGKLLVGLAYTLLLSAFLLLIGRLPTEALPLLSLFMILGAVLFLLAGLVLGAWSKTGTEVNTYGSVVFMVALMPIMLNMPGFDLEGSPVGAAIHIIPNFYMVDGMRRALEGTTTPESLLINIGATLAAIVALFLLATWVLRRQQLQNA